MRCQSSAPYVQAVWKKPRLLKGVERRMSRAASMGRTVPKGCAQPFPGPGAG
jgi:hypothetical protein